MTREELIQSPEYWRTLYENECERLGIKPILTFLSPIDEEELDEMTEQIVLDALRNNDIYVYNIEGKTFSAPNLKELVKAGLRAKEAIV